MPTFIRFLLGLAAGSFLNVLVLRYDSEHALFGRRVIGGRSHCPHCKRVLRWYELVPVLSYIWLRGRCRTCRARISIQYPIVELISGLIFAYLPIASHSYLALIANYQLLITAVWIAALVLLLLMSLIDARTRIIPDEIHWGLLILGLARVFYESRGAFQGGSSSFFSSYALLFGLEGNIWLNHLTAAAFGLVFFMLLVLITRGRGMGFGDVKLAAALGFLYGWPDIVLITVFAFILGAFFGIWKIFFRRGGLKSIVPFGPFLALATLVAMLWGNQILSWYFASFGII